MSASQTTPSTPTSTPANLTNASLVPSSSTHTSTPVPSSLSSTTTNDSFSLKNLFSPRGRAESTTVAPRETQKLEELAERVADISEGIKLLLGQIVKKDEQRTARPQHIVRLNVGGRIFVTSHTTLTKTHHDCMLTSMFSSRFGEPQCDEHGAVFIDRDPTHFGLILNFLRDNEISLPLDELLLSEILREAEFYQIKDLTSRVRALLKQVQRNNQRRTTKEKEYKILSNVKWEDIDKEVLRMTRDGFDFESWLPSSDDKLYHVLFSKRLSQEEVAMLDRITNNVF